MTKADIFCYSASYLLFGAGLFAAIYPNIKDGVLKTGDYGDITLPRLLKANGCAVVVLVGILILLILFMLDKDRGSIKLLINNVNSADTAVVTPKILNGYTFLHFFPSY